MFLFLHVSYSLGNVFNLRTVHTLIHFCRQGIEKGTSRSENGQAFIIIYVSARARTGERDVSFPRDSGIVRFEQNEALIFAPCMSGQLHYKRKRCFSFSSKSLGQKQSRQNDEQSVKRMTAWRRSSNDVLRKDQCFTKEQPCVHGVHVRTCPLRR